MKYIVLSLVWGILFWSLPTVLGAQEEQQGHIQYGVKAVAAGFFYQTQTNVDVSVGWRFNQARYLGLGTGWHRVELYDDAGYFAEDGSYYDDNNGRVPAVPLYIDYMRYFVSRRHPCNALYIGTELGVGVYVDKLPLKHYDSYFFPYLDLKIGWDFTVHNNIAFNVGFNTIFPVPGGIGVSAGLRF